MLFWLNLYLELHPGSELKKPSVSPSPLPHALSFFSPLSLCCFCSEECTVCSLMNLDHSSSKRDLSWRISSHVFSLELFAINFFSWHEMMCIFFEYKGNIFLSVLFPNCSLILCQSCVSVQKKHPIHLVFIFHVNFPFNWFVTVYMCSWNCVFTLKWRKQLPS